MSIELIALLAAFALVLGFMGAIGVGDLKRDLGGKIEELEKKCKVLDARTQVLNDRGIAVEKTMNAKTDVELEEIATLKARMDALEAPKPTKKAKPATKTKRGPNGRFTKKDK